MGSRERYESGRVIASEPYEAGVEEVNAEQTRGRAEQAFNGLRAVTNSTGTLTAVQLSNAVRLLATVLLHLLRLQLGRHEDTD